MTTVSIFQLDPNLGPLHTEAERHDEWAAKRFMLYYFTRHVFRESHWVTGTELPPREDHCQLRMDVGVQQFEESRRAFVFRLIGQAKKGRSGPKKIIEVEAQAVQLCKEYMTDPRWNPEINTVWVLTYYGTKLRIWVCRLKDTELDPFYPLDGKPGDKKAYRDVKEYEHHFAWAFKQVRGMDPPKSSEIRALHKIDTPADTVDAVSAQAPAVTSASPAGLSMRASHHAAGSFKQQTSGQAMSGHGDIQGQVSKVKESEFDPIHVLKVSADFTLCKDKDGNEFKVRRENWRKAILTNDNGDNKGYIAQLSKKNLYTYDNPVDISEERGKGKGKAH